MSNIALRNLITGRWEPLGGATNGAVKCLAVYDGELIAGGRFTVIGGQSCNHIARWNGFDWQPVGNNVDWTEVTALTVYDGALIAAGILHRDTGYYQRRALGRLVMAIHGQFPRQRRCLLSDRAWWRAVRRWKL